MKLRKAYDEVEFEVSAVQEAALRVFERVLEVSGEGNTEALCRLLVDAGEAGSVIGKGGKNVTKIRRESGVRIRVLSGGELPSGVSYPDQVVEVTFFLSFQSDQSLLLQIKISICIACFV